MLIKSEAVNNIQITQTFGKRESIWLVTKKQFLQLIGPANIKGPMDHLDTGFRWKNYWCQYQMVEKRKWL